MKRKVAFIVNPNSGADRKSDRIALIKEHAPENIDYEIISWLSPDHNLKQIIEQGSFDVVAAVGGDGTVNCTATLLRNQKSALAIIPFGSGNGLARHLKIPLDIKKAIKLTGEGKISAMDSCEINGQAFFCTSGAGFDAHIGKLFAASKKRGFYSYFKIILNQIRIYRCEEYELVVDQNREFVKAFLITVANASQYGNNAYIAPLAQVNDGLMNVSILKPFKAWNVPSITWRMFNQTLHKSRFVETRTGRDIIIRRKEPGAAHYDGEPCEMGATLNFKIIPDSLKVLVPQELA